MGKQCQVALRVVQETSIMKNIFDEDAEAEFIKGAKDIVHFLILYEVFKPDNIKVFEKCYSGMV